MQGSGTIQGATSIAVTRWVARILAAIEILVGVIVLASIFLPAAHRTHAPLPLVLKGAPFGTYV
jgi:hypothetical protein